MALTLNNFTGFETQGNEEASSVVGTPTYETTNHRTGGSALSVDGTSDDYDIPWVAVGVTDAGADYIIGFALRKNTNPGTTAAVVGVADDAPATILQVSLNTSGALELKNAAGATLDTSSALNDDQWYYVEIYAQLNNASGAWEWFIDGITEGSGIGADFTDGNTFGTATSDLGFGSTTSVVMLFDDVYILSGATASSDRLGGSSISQMPEVFGYQCGAGTTRTGTPTNGTFTETGDTLAAEEADGTALEAAGASALTLVSDLDDPANPRGLSGGPSMLTGDTYYFDTSDAGPTDNDAVWSNDANAFDGGIVTNANTSTVGTKTTNELRGEGTTAPGSGGTLGDVFFRVRHVHGITSGVMGFSIETDAAAEELLNDTDNASAAGSGVIKQSSWFKLTAPTGGWTFAKIQSLEIIMWKDSGGGNMGVHKAEIFVEHTTGAEKFPFDVSGTIKGAKYIFRLKRGAGSGTSLRYLYGNSGDGETSSADINPVLVTAYAIFEQISEAAGVVPTSSEDFSVGISAGTTDTGGREIFASEIWAMLLHVPAAGGQTISVGLALETDTAFGIVPERIRAIGLAAEADTGFVVVPAHSVTLGLAPETDVAFVVDWSKGVNVGLVIETDTAFATPPERIHVIGLTAEADTGFIIVPAHVVPLGLATEADTAFAIEHFKTVLIGLASEADTAFPVVPLRTRLLGLAAETDTAFAVPPAHLVVLGLASETDTAFPITAAGAIIIAVGQALEADTAFGIEYFKTVLIGLATETDIGLAIAILKTVFAGQAAETDTAFPVVPERVRLVGLAAESDTAFVAAPEKSITLGLAAEADTAFVTTWAKTVLLGLAAETDTAFATPPVRQHAVGLAAETDIAQPLAKIIKTVLLGLAQEFDIAQGLQGDVGPAAGSWLWRRWRRW